MSKAVVLENTLYKVGLYCKFAIEFFRQIYPGRQLLISHFIDQFDSTMWWQRRWSRGHQDVAYLEIEFQTSRKQRGREEKNDLVDSTMQWQRRWRRGHQDVGYLEVELQTSRRQKVREEKNELDGKEMVGHWRGRKGL